MFSKILPFYLHKTMQKNFAIFPTQNNAIVSTVLANSFEDFRTFVLFFCSVESITLLLIEKVDEFVTSNDICLLLKVRVPPKAVLRNVTCHDIATKTNFSTCLKERVVKRFFVKFDKIDVALSLYEQV